jgi:hypothetical protein
MSSAAYVRPQLFVKTCTHCRIVKGRHHFGEASSMGMLQMIWKYVQCDNCDHRTNVRDLPPLIVDLD